jgi:hypothetical protein
VGQLEVAGRGATVPVLLSLITGDVELYLRRHLDEQSPTPGVPEDAVREYLRCMTPECVHADCEGYRRGDDRSRAMSGTTAQETRYRRLVCVSEALVRFITLEHQGRLLDPDEAPVGVSLRKHVHFLEDPLSVALDQIDDVAFCIAVSVGEFVQNGDTGVLDDLSEVDDMREEPGAVVPASVCALAEGGSEMQVDRLVCWQLLVVE